MDVIGNNISNVNTVAFKAGRVTFKEGFAQLLQGASRPPGDQGGINPIQVGLGMQIGSIDQLFSQGNIPSAVAMLCRAARRVPVMMHAHFRPRRAAGRPRKIA